MFLFYKNLGILCNKEYPFRNTDYEGLLRRLDKSRYIIMKGMNPVVKEIPLKNRCGAVVAMALIDEEDYELVSPYSWYLHTAGYAMAHPKGKDRITVLMHRLIMGSDVKLVDHINRNRLDNRRENLRPASPQMNAANRGISKRNKSGYKGVSKCKNRWRSRIMINGKEINLGFYATPEEAAEAYNEAALEYLGEYAVLNEIPQKSLPKVA